MKKQVFALFLSIVLCLSLVACGGSQTNSTTAQPSESQAQQSQDQATNAEATTAADKATETTAEQPADTTADKAAEEPLNVVALKGPTALGLLKMMDEQTEKYNINVLGAPDAVVPQIVKGEVDVACIPSNMAAVLYQKTKGNVHVIGLNTLGVLHLVEKGDTVKSIADLKGKKVVSAGKGAVPEYLFNLVLKKNGLKPEDVQVEYLADHSAVLAALAKGDATIAVLPQPFLTVAMQKVQGLRDAFDLSKESPVPVVTGVYVATSKALKDKADLVKNFLKDAATSVQFVNDHPDAAGKLSEKFDIIKPAAIAEKAIPHCAIVCLTDEEMQPKLDPFLKALFESNPKTVGGQLPGPDFYALLK